MDSQSGGMNSALQGLTSRQGKQRIVVKAIPGSKSEHVISVLNYKLKIDQNTTSKPLTFGFTVKTLPKGQGYRLYLTSTRKPLVSTNIDDLIEEAARAQFGYEPK